MQDTGYRRFLMGGSRGETGIFSGGGDENLGGRFRRGCGFHEGIVDPWKNGEGVRIGGESGGIWSSFSIWETPESTAFRFAADRGTGRVQAGAVVICSQIWRIWRS